MRNNGGKLAPQGIRLSWVSIVFLTTEDLHTKEPIEEDKVSEDENLGLTLGFIILIA